jgi:hypothetical protein
MFQYQLAVWECNNASWNEASLSKNSSPNPPNASSNITNISPWQSRINFSARPDIKQYIALVHHHTRRKLTYGDDALHAISSLLSIMSSSFSGGFISGLPEMFFNEALLWQPKEPMQRRRCSERLNELPSWSWAGWESEIEELAWLRHWSHLYPSQTRPGHPVLQVSPLVTWFYGNNLEERFPINISGQTYIKTLNDRSIPLPPKWTPSLMWGKSAPIDSWTPFFFFCIFFDRDADYRYADPLYHRYVYDNLEHTGSAYPLPVPSNQSACFISARYLFCRATRAYLKSTKRKSASLIAGIWQNLSNLSTFLQDSDGYMVGQLNLNLGLMDFTEPPNNTKFELVAISSGAAKNHNLGVKNPIFETTIWKMIGLSKIVGFYYVLWIEWINGIAYRKGLGRERRMGS